MFLAIYEDLEVFKGLDGFLKGLVISVIATLVFLITSLTSAWSIASKSNSISFPVK